MMEVQRIAQIRQNLARAMQPPINIPQLLEAARAAIALMYEIETEREVS